MPDPQPATPDLLAMFASTEAGSELEAKIHDVFRAFGQAMVYGQLLEWATGLGAPALQAPTDDEQSSSSAVTQGLRRDFFNAINALGAAAASTGLPPELEVRLHAARTARNGLAHEWVWSGGMRAFAGHGDEVIAELDALSETFVGLINELTEAVFVGALAARGVEPDQFAVVRDGLTAALLARPDLADGVSFPYETDVFAERITDALAAEESEG